MLLSFILQILAKNFKVKYFTLSDRPINENLLSYRKFKMKLNNQEYIFSNGSKKYLINPCKYLAESSKAFGHLNVCNGFSGIICSTDCYEIEAVNKDFTLIRATKYDQNNIEIKVSNRSKFTLEVNGHFEYKKGKVLYKNSLNLSHKKIIKLRIGFINEYDRYTELKDDVYNDTLEIFKNAKKIIENLNFDYFRFELVNTIILTRTTSPLLSNKNDEALEDFEKRISHIKNVNRKLQTSDLLVLITNDGINEQEGLSYYGGMKDFDTRYIIINLNQEDTPFYKGKVLVHEILHTLGSLHDKGNQGLLMDELFVNKNDKNIRLSYERKLEIESFVLKNIDKFN